MIIDAFQVMLTPKKYMARLGSAEIAHAPWWGPMYIALMALLPAGGFYYGTVVQGWPIVDRHLYITPETGLLLAIGFYFTLVAVTTIVGLLLSWMSATYHAEFNPIQGIETAGLVATPVFLAGLAAIYPVFWFDLLLGTVVAGYAALLLSIAIRERLKLPEELVYLYTLAMNAAVLVIACGVLGASTYAWTFIVTPVFTEAAGL